jgi:hypothetical protein
MGRGWVKVRDGVRQGILRANDVEARDVVERWEQFIDYVALGLSQDLGRDVSPVRPRKQSLAERSDAHLKRLVGDGVLSGEMRVPDAAGTITLDANLRTQQVTTSTRVDAPREGRQATRVNWLLRQLVQASDGLRLTGTFAGTRDTSSVLLGEAREDPIRLLHPVDPRREIRTFEVAMTRALGARNGRAQGTFIGDTRQQVIDFYAEVVQNLSSWQAKAPKLPPPPDVVPDEPQSEPPPFVAASEREVGEGRLNGDESPDDESPPSALPWAAPPRREANDTDEDL